MNFPESKVFLFVAWLGFGFDFFQISMLILSRCLSLTQTTEVLGQVIWSEQRETIKDDAGAGELSSPLQY